MASTTTVTPLGGAAPPLPGSNLIVGNVVGAAKIAEKTVELTTCAQFGSLLGSQMVWFGLTQRQERQHGFDAATNLGGRAFILQFKVSSTVLKSGPHAGHRRFGCQHHQMDQLVQSFGATPNACFYFLPNLGTFAELSALGGDVLSNSYLMDVAGLQSPVPAPTRMNGYHYAYLDAAGPSVTITSEPFKARRLFQGTVFLKEIMLRRDRLPNAKGLLRLAQRLDRENRRLADLFYRNAALAVLL